MHPRLRKIWADIRSARNRFLMMSMALTASITVVSAIFTAYAILQREVPRNYLSTHPASAQLQLEHVDAALIQAVRQRADIADAQASATVSGRIEVGPNQWMPLLLFVIPDFEQLRINAFRSQSGDWPPPIGSMLVERSALPLTHAAIGAAITVQTGGSGKRTLRIAGVVHDAGLAPAWQEQTIYGYVTPATLATLGESSALNLLKITLRHGNDDVKQIERSARALVLWLRARGQQVHEVRIPPPLRHPHQGQLNAVVRMLQIFSVLTLILGAILCATMIGGLLAQQSRQIAIMKAIGARSTQIAGLYLSLVAAIGAVSVGVALPLGLCAGRGFVAIVAELLNLQIASDAVPLGLSLGVIAMGILVPVGAALIPILAASRRSVRAAIDDHGVTRINVANTGKSIGLGSIDRLLARIRLNDAGLTLALRNTFRRRTRLLMTLALLATAGAMFIASINMKLAWEDFVSKAVAYQHYDLELRLQQPMPEQQVIEQVSALSGVRKVEAWNFAAAAIDQDDDVDIVRTYPDGGHGSLSLRSAPPATDLVDIHLLSGRWLQSTDTTAIVLNQLASTANFPEVQVGEWIALEVDEHPLRVQVVGIARELLTPASGYVNASTFAQATGDVGNINALRIAFADNADSGLTASLLAALESNGIGIKTVMSKQRVGAAQAGHIYILVFALGFIGTMMAVVGVLGLTSMLSTNVIERTRELGVMRAIGARGGQILKCIIGEGLLAGWLSWMIAVPLSIPISVGVGKVLASISNQPLTLSLSLSSAALWFLLVTIAAAGAAYFPARAAARLTIRQTLAVN